MYHRLQAPRVILDAITATAAAACAGSQIHCPTRQLHACEPVNSRCYPLTRSHRQRCRYRICASKDQVSADSASPIDCCIFDQTATARDAIAVALLQPTYFTDWFRNHLFGSLLTQTPVQYRHQQNMPAGRMALSCPYYIARTCHQVQIRSYHQPLPIAASVSVAQQAYSAMKVDFTALLGKHMNSSTDQRWYSFWQ
jgi:hypothetical protein